jgi:hypothetical protein
MQYKIIALESYYFVHIVKYIIRVGAALYRLRAGTYEFLAKKECTGLK